MQGSLFLSFTQQLICSSITIFCQIIIFKRKRKTWSSLFWNWFISLWNIKEMHGVHTDIFSEFRTFWYRNLTPILDLGDLFVKSSYVNWHFLFKFNLLDGRNFTQVFFCSTFACSLVWSILWYNLYKGSQWILFSHCIEISALSPPYFQLIYPMI